MSHIPYGYIIKNGTAIIDEEKASKIQKLYKNYLSGMTLHKAASEAGISTYHGTAKHMMENSHYLGDSFYPAIIDKETFDKAAQELHRRAILLGRINRQKEITPAVADTSFHWKKPLHHYEDPQQQAEYLYSLIESEAI